MNMSAGNKSRQISEGSNGGKPSFKFYTLEIYPIGGPESDEFDLRAICRTIRIRGDQTIEGLHKAIFKAFDRFDCHPYEFILGEGPDDKSAIYSLPSDNEVPGQEDEMPGDVCKTTIDSLGLEVGRAFWYRFHFGDDWLHQINVTAIEDSLGK